MTLATTFGLVALSLAAIGIYGVLAYAVTQRTKEISVRMALGSTTTAIFRLIVREGVGLILVGFLLGTLGAMALKQTLESQLVGTSVADPFVLISATGLLVLVAILASVLEQPGVQVSPGRHYFGCGGVILACFDPRADGDSRDARPNPDHVYFAVPDLDTYYARVSTLPQTSLLQPIRTQPWGERSFYCADPFGNKLCFVDERTLFTAGLV